MPPARSAFLEPEELDSEDDDEILDPWDEYYNLLDAGDDAD